MTDRGSIGFRRRRRTLPPLSPQLSEAGDELSENGNGELDMDADDEAALAF